MVREVKQTLIFILLILLAPLGGCARIAYAEEQVEPIVQYVGNSSSTDARLDTISQQLSDVQVYLSDEKAERDRQRAEKELAAQQPQEEPQEDADTTLLREISGQLGTIAGNVQPEQLTESSSVKASEGIALTAYTNVSPTGSYVRYAAGVLPKLKWNENYVFVQVTNSEYYMVWGDLTLADGKISGESCKFLRWYYSGQQLGTVVQSGVGNISVDPASYTVLSSLGDWPLLDDGISMLRNEVAFYAVVAAVVFSLASVWSFVIRMRSS